MSIPDVSAFKARFEAEVSRTRRCGGFLSVAAFGPGNGVEAAGENTQALHSAAARIEGRVRAYDHLGWSDERTLLVVMPDANLSQAMSAGARLLRLADDGVISRPFLAAGVATGYGEIEGGAEALVEAACEALRTASPLSVGASETLKGAPRVLVVDDDNAFVHALCDRIAESGWRADPCVDAVDAAARVQESGYQALFVDLVMPERSGIQILALSMARFPKRPTVLMSGHDAYKDVIIEALSWGPVMFVRKPLSREDLESALSMCRALLPGLGRE
ncbi:MAG: response regulator [Vicinamibacteria bacterium]|nr:response regulator [Vicinamibacteria bacterium]